MAQVMFDKAIKFEGSIYSVTQSWSGPRIVVSSQPPNDDLCQLIENIVEKKGQITLRAHPGYFELEQQN